MRVWFLKETKSICTSCGTGCNVLVGSREQKVYRLTPRENGEVNSHWMCDQGRLGFHYIESKERLVTPTIRMRQAIVRGLWKDLFPQMAAQLKKYQPWQIAFLASARMTNEELFLLHKIRQALGGAEILCDVIPRTGKADAILRSADLNPNTNGATLFGLNAEGKNLSKIIEGINGGQIKALYALHEDIVEAGLPEANLAKLDLILAQSILPTATSLYAHFVLPSASFAEKRGTMINVNGRLQRLNQAVQPPGEAREDLEILLSLLSALNEQHYPPSIETVFQAMTAEFPTFAGLNLGKVGDLGVELA